MLRNLKLIFIHGVAGQNTNYSRGLYRNVLSACRARLQSQGYTGAAIDDALSTVVQHEVMWANYTTDLTNRYMQLAYADMPFLWGKITGSIDPLAIQIMQYIKDKGDKNTGLMNILEGVDHEIRRIFALPDIGEDPAPNDGQNAIIVAHSLGSVIAFDYIMGFRKAHRLDPDVNIKSFITMGSPIPAFISAMGHPDSDLNLPPNVHKWVNIRSPRDGIARPMPPFFRNIPIDEHLVRTRFFPISAHTAYWSDDRTAAIIADEVLAALSRISA